MIAYEELVAALDRYVARHGGTPESVRAPASSAPPPAMPSRYEPPTSQVSMPPSYDEHHDPDLGAHGQHEPHEDDATHVGSSPGAMPPPLAPVGKDGEEDHSNEIDVGDVLVDDEV